MKNSKSKSKKELDKSNIQDIRSMFQKASNKLQENLISSGNIPNQVKDMEMKKTDKIVEPLKEIKIDIVKKPRKANEMKEKEDFKKTEKISKEKLIKVDSKKTGNKTLKNVLLDSESEEEIKKLNKSKSPAKNKSPLKKNIKKKGKDSIAEDDISDEEYKLGKEDESEDSDFSDISGNKKEKFKNVTNTKKETHKRIPRKESKIEENKNNRHDNKNPPEIDDEEMKIIEKLFEEMDNEERKEIGQIKKSNINHNLATPKTNKKNIKKIIEDESLLDDASSFISEKKSKKTTKPTEKSTVKKKASNKKEPNPDIHLENGGGLTFVITGLMKIDRNELTNILKGYGAKVTGSVSKKTTYLAIGDVLEDGRQVNESKKYKTAEELKIKILNYDELQELLREKLDNPDFELDSLDWKTAKTLEILKQNCNIPTDKPMSFLKNTDDKNVTVSTIKLPHTESNIKQDHKMDIDSEYKNNNNFKEKTTIIENDNELWTTKYTPKNVNEFIGNPSNISKIIQWLNDWDDVVLRGNLKENNESAKSRYKNENPNSKALLISGDPGVGKTSSIRLLGKLLNYKVFELNASDQRNKNIILKKVGFLTDNTTLDSKKDERVNQKNLIVMDEIDGMAGNEDRGGVAALIQIIKNTKVPIICICNDRQNQKLKSLANYCYDIKFSKPDKRQITKRMVEICNLEGLKVEENAIENLCESVGNDIRQCLNFLQFWSRKFTELKFFDMKNHFDKFSKDSLVMLNHFDAVTKLLTRVSYAKFNFREKLNMFFLDYDLVPLLMHENYLSGFKEKNQSTLIKIAKSSDHISFGDILDKRIRTNNQWNLLQDKGIHSSVAVGHYSANFLGFPKFPELFGKMSSMKKVKREIKELKHYFFGISQISIKEEVCPLVLSYITSTLTELGKEGIDKCIDFLQEYRLPIDKFKENVLDLQTKESIIKKYEKLNTGIKSSFTRKYNSINKTSIKRRKMKLPGEAIIIYDEDGNVVEEIKSEDEEDFESLDDIEAVTVGKKKK